MTYTTAIHNLETFYHVSFHIRDHITRTHFRVDSKEYCFFFQIKFIYQYYASNDETDLKIVGTVHRLTYLDFPLSLLF